MREVGYSNVAIRIGDGSRGWAEHGPYDKILVTAAAAEPPPALIQQLKPGGRLVLPMGGAEVQFLTTIDKEEGNDICVRQLIPVRFGPLETVI